MKQSQICVSITTEQLHIEIIVLRFIKICTVKKKDFAYSYDVYPMGMVAYGAHYKVFNIYGTQTLNLNQETY